MNIVALLGFGFFFAILSFVIRNFALGQEFDLVSEAIQLITVLATVAGAGFLLRKTLNKEAPIQLKTKV